MDVLGSMICSQFSVILNNFRRKKWLFFSNTNVMMQFLHYLASF
jgi:hypothetical protein